MSYLAPPDFYKDVVEYVQERTGVYTPLGPVQVMGFVNEDEEIVGGFMFERYTGVTGSVHTHWAGNRDQPWLSGNILKLVSIYVYDQLGCDVMFGEVRRSDKYVRRIDERIGFEKVAVLPAYFPDDDLVVYSMTKRQCRFLPDEYKEPLHG